MGFLLKDINDNFLLPLKEMISFVDWWDHPKKNKKLQGFRRFTMSQIEGSISLPDTKWFVQFPTSCNLEVWIIQHM